MIPLIILIVDLYRYSPHSVKYLKNVFTSVFTLFLRKMILFLSVSLALGQIILLIIQIVDLVESIKKYIDNDNSVCSVFIDLEKAFDAVDHQIFNIRDLAHIWFRSYLSNRQQFVFISGSSSELMSIECGVPQGSTSGPLLFLLYINDFNSVFNKVILLMTLT